MTAQAGGASLSSREHLRQQMRALRRAIGTTERIHARRQFALILGRKHLRPSRRIAIYLAYGSEADLADVIALARARRCRLYLPVITDYRRHRMSFVAFDAGARMRVNRYGIPEPDVARKPAGASRIAVRHLDLVLVPLVAVDAHGWRLGSGAGFYDRCLHQLRPHPGGGSGWRRPKLIGVGFELQRVPHIEPGPWDVPLDAVLTERNLYRLPHPTRARNDRALHSPSHSTPSHSQ